MVTADMLRGEGYHLPRQLADGRWIGLRGMYATIGLFVGLDETGYSCRYCYPTSDGCAGDALVDVQTWDGTGDPPGRWIKQKGGPGGDRLNPRWVAEAAAELRVTRQRSDDRGAWDYPGRGRHGR